MWSVSNCFSHLDLTASGARTPSLLNLKVLREQCSDERTDHKHTTNKGHCEVITHPRTHTHAHTHTQFLQLAALHQLDDVIKQHVSVPLTEPADII